MAEQLSETHGPAGAGSTSRKSAIGYACKVVGVSGMALRSCTLKTATPERLREICRDNLAALGRMVDYNDAAGIGLFRISSDVIPFASHPDVAFPWRSLCEGELSSVGESIRRTGLRVSMHPGQYTVLNSPDADVARRACADVVYHADFLDALGTGPEAKIVLHVGGVYGDREKGLARFAERFRTLPQRAARRIIVENDERNYAIDDVCRLAGSLSIPAVMDILHHRLLPPAEGREEEWLRRCAETWKPEDGRQKIHYSQQLPGGKPGMHSHTVRIRDFLEFHRKYATRSLDIMLEVKDKNVSALKCAQCVAARTPRRALTEAWAWYKYAVLEHSQASYLRLRSLLKAREPSAVGFYSETESALSQAAAHGSAVNAAEHVWGHFKGMANAREKQRFESLLPRVEKPKENASLKRHFLRLAEKYNERYILNSLYLHTLPTAVR